MYNYSVSFVPKTDETFCTTFTLVLSFVEGTFNPAQTETCIQR